MLPRVLRVRARREYDAVFKRGRSLSGGALLLRWIPNNLTHSRVGIVVSNKISKRAVVRNLIRRRTREAVRTLMPTLAVNADIVLVARPSAVTATYAEILHEVSVLFGKVGMTTPPRRITPSS